MDVNTQGHVRIDARKAQADEKWSDSAAVASQRLRPLRRSRDTLAKFGDNASSVTHSSAILKLHSLLQSQYITTLAVVGEVSAPRASTVNRPSIAFNSPISFVMASSGSFPLMELPDNAIVEGTCAQIVPIWPNHGAGSLNGTAKLDTAPFPRAATSSASVPVYALGKHNVHPIPRCRPRAGRIPALGR